MAGKLGLLGGVLVLSGASAALLVYAAQESARTPPRPTVFLDKTPRVDGPPGPAEEPGKTSKLGDDDEAYAFPLPSGRPSSVSCGEAHTIVQQVRSTLAYVALPPTASALATATADWLDPHGLWTASPDSPIPAVLDRHAAQLLRDLEEDAAPCAGARSVADAMVPWITELGARFDDGRHGEAASAHAITPAALREAVEATPFEDEAEAARPLAQAMGEQVGRIERSVGSAVGPYADAARARFFPPLDAEQWSGVVLAATVRAYVQLTDLHGQWAPHDEEASVYDVDLDAHPPDRLWDRAARTALGVRIDSAPMEPLAVGDVVLSIDEVTTAGLPLEQLDQLVYATTGAASSAPLVVLRRGEHAVRSLTLPAPAPAITSDEDAEPLPAYRVPYGASDALVIEIHDVRSDLGDELAATLRQKQREKGRPLSELLLDLRDDGGGSTEGVIAAIGLFLPGVPLFPMARRDGSIEVDRAPEPPTALRWTGPVATLVDSDTASAAEMMAGALLAYRRGPVVGEPTYGKGCAQEYLDDDAHVGVLRLTTLLYALPDGSPVQGVGIEPSVLLPRLSPDGPKEHESDAPNAPPTWRGPDVRDRSRVIPAAMTWPEHAGKVGPCRDAEVCRALLALGAAPPVPTGKRSSAALTPPTTPGHR